MVKVQKEKIQSGQKGIRDLKTSVGRKSCISTGEARWTKYHNEGIQAGGVRGGSHNVGRCSISRRNRGAARSTAPGVRAAKSFESRKGEK